IAARAEGLVAGAREHGDADRRVPPRVKERVGQLGDGDRPERVADLGPVDRDPGDAVLLLVEDVCVRHGASDRSQSDLRRRWPSSPTTPRRKVSTQTTKMTPWTTVTQAPSCAR